MGYCETDYTEWSKDSKSIKEFLQKKIWGNELKDGRTEILEQSIVGRVLYAAVVRRLRDEIDRFILVVPFYFCSAEKGWDRIGYKAMTSDVGPCEASCPKKILKLVEPTNDLDIEWRARCDAYRAKRNLRRVAA